jgi:hypothetical protein
MSNKNKKEASIKLIPEEKPVKYMAKEDVFIKSDEKIILHLYRFIKKHIATVVAVVIVMLIMGLIFK